MAGPPLPNEARSASHADAANSQFIKRCLSFVPAAVWEGAWEGQAVTSDKQEGALSWHHQPRKPALFIQQRPCTFCVLCHLTIKGLICLCYGNMIVTQTLCSWDFQEFVRKYSRKIYEQILPKRRGPRLRHFFFPLLEQLNNGCWCFPAGWLAPVRKAEIAHLFWLCAPCLPPQGTRKNWRKKGRRLKKQSCKF